MVSAHLRAPRRDKGRDRRWREIVRLKAAGGRPSEIASRLGIGRASVYLKQDTISL
jgi:hypothetical protein